MITKTLQNLIAYASNKWQLKDIRRIETGSSGNYVAIAYSKKFDVKVVLKILTDNTQEIESLTFFDGNGIIKILDFDLKHKILLLPYLNSKQSLQNLFPQNESQAIEIVARIIKKLRTKSLENKPSGFCSINQWLSVLDTFDSKNIPEHQLKKARELSKTLLQSNSEFYLLHGDLHHDNVLQHNDEWLAIDPKGIIGPIEWEIGRFIMNPIPELLEQQDAKDIIKNRINRFSEIFNLEKKQIIDWAFVQSILSACWAEQDKNEKLLNYSIKLVKIVDTE